MTLCFRYGGVFTIGMAYRGTANNAAIQKLLHFAVSDVSDDVRRAAVMNLGFLLLGVPEQCPKIVSLLSESYNPHVRYGDQQRLGLHAIFPSYTASIAMRVYSLRSCSLYIESLRLCLKFLHGRPISLVLTLQIMLVLGYFS